MYKLILSWDIKPSLDQEYFEFMLREFAPRIDNTELKPIEAWFSAYGEGPQIVVEGLTDDLDSMRRFLASEEWQALHSKLMEYVQDYQQKVVIGRPDLQL